MTNKGFGFSVQDHIDQQKASEAARIAREAARTSSQPADYKPKHRR